VNHLALDAKDIDLNSSGATLIPGTRLVLGGGKQGVLYSLDTRHLGHLGDEHAVQHFQATASHTHSLVYWASAKHGPLLYVWGQRDTARAYAIDGEKVNQTPVMLQDVANEGHPGAMLSLSANGGTNGILWAAIHATGDSWHESRPGVLHAFDADDISHELWSSLDVPERDDCGRYSKMAPPTIANGMVYLASFGTENVGTGQLCVYGLLPGSGAAPPPVPSGATTTVHDRQLTLTWHPAPGARFYRIQRATTRALEPKTVATGLTTATFSEPAPAPGESATYTIFAVGRGGVSGGSEPVVVAVDKRRPR